MTEREKVQKNLYGRLEEIWKEIGKDTQDALAKHLLGGTSARVLADTLRSEGYPIGATTIKDWRRRAQL